MDFGFWTLDTSAQADASRWQSLRLALTATGCCQGQGYANGYAQPAQCKFWILDFGFWMRLVLGGNEDNIFSPRPPRLPLPLLVMLRDRLEDIPCHIIPGMAA